MKEYNVRNYSYADYRDSRECECDRLFEQRGEDIPRIAEIPETDNRRRCGICRAAERNRDRRNNGRRNNERSNSRCRRASRRNIG